MPFAGCGLLLMRRCKLAVLTCLLALPVLGAMPARAQVSASDIVVRLEQLESQMRELTGAIEQLQYRNQQLEQYLQRMQQDADLRPQDSHPPPGGAVSPPPGQRPLLRNRPTALPGPAAQPGSGRRSDAFDPTQHPNAPGAPRVLGNPAVVAAPPPPSEIMSDEPPLDVPGGRVPGSPLDLSRLNDPQPPAEPPQGQFAPRAPGPTMATLPPSQTPKDEYDLSYGYFLRKDYALAEEGFRSFLKKYEKDRSARSYIPDAHYWLGETLFQRQRYQDAADYFLMVVRNYETAAKAPDSMLRLGQSLAALGERETACATLSQVGFKYPRASLSVRQGVEREQKRVRC